jgi:hypothetical protein
MMAEMDAAEVVFTRLKPAGENRVAGYTPKLLSAIRKDVPLFQEVPMNRPLENEIAKRFGT